MGESVTEGTVSRWLKSAGDAVTEGETVAEVTTDKVDVEVPAPATGVLSEVVASEGETLPVGGVMARIQPGEATAATPRAAQPASTPASVPASPAQSTAPAAPVPQVAVPAAPVPAPVAPAPAAAAAVAVSPLARRAAAISGTDIWRVNGTGPAGSVRRADIGAPQGRNGSSATQAPAGAKTTPLTGPAATLAGYMERSLDIPTATSFRTIAVAQMDMQRRRLNAALKSAGIPVKISFTHIVGYAISQAAAEMPVMATSFARDKDGKPVRVETGIHLGLAVDSTRKDGTRFLVVPVIRDAGQLTFADFVTEYERLIAAARSNSLTADELQGATLTLTNPGGIGTVASVPRLMPGQGCIIATGAIGYPPEWHDASPAQRDQAGVVKTMTMTSTYDHRVIQGAQSGEFLGAIETRLADPGFYSRLFSSLGVVMPAAPPPATTAPAPVAPLQASDKELLSAMQAATSVIDAHRTHGHLSADLDPLGPPAEIDPAMDPAKAGITDELMAQIPATLLRVYVPGSNLAEVLPNLKRTYSGKIAYELEYISSHDQRTWLHEHIESGAFRLPASKAERLITLERLIKVETMERYFRKTFVGQKTFSIEGLDSMIPMLESLLTMVADDGIAEVIMGMSHRGRNAVIAHVVNRPYEEILAAFERGELRQAVGSGDDDPTGDVKYHLGAVGTYHTAHDREIPVTLLPNPSHLEAVDAVVEGWVRADQTDRTHNIATLDRSKSIAILIHGDAAFSAEGVVAEVLNLQSLKGYSTGGTIHIIANNQIGFTTDMIDGRSTRYASDLAKGFDVPIVHVNADDVEACVDAIRFAYDYRQTYHRDVVIDLVGYRRLGHNESDEPAYTQPLMYRAIKQHPTVREIFAQRLIDDGVITQAEVEAMSEAAYARIADAHKALKARIAAGEKLLQIDLLHGSSHPALSERTAVPADQLRDLDAQLTAVPEGFTLNPKLPKQFERRHESFDNGTIDWGTAESLAFASLLREGHPIRLSGQDSERGTFSHRHLVLHDDKTGETYTPLQHIEGARASFEIHNSPLSEVGCLGFEYGYSASAQEALVLWEAQFGDFVNNAQMVIDQFIASANAKWGQHSRLVLLLPHGIEGMGPEHSSGRLERFLDVAAHANMRVVNCSTSAQYFHLLRDQAHSDPPMPLVIMTPKGLLRAPHAAATLQQLSSGGFEDIFDDPSVTDRGAIKTLLLCTGRIYYDLVRSDLRPDATDLAVGRVEMLNPAPLYKISEMMKAYPNLQQAFWVQEEPSNMGAWPFLSRQLEGITPPGVTLDYVGRQRRASPSEGYAGSTAIEQERIVSSALLNSALLQRKTGRKPEVAGER
jgi:2-oxoglutarate dehydrogenase E1 component